MKIEIRSGVIQPDAPVIFLLSVKKKVNFSLLRSIIILNKEFLQVCLYGYKA